MTDAGQARRGYLEQLRRVLPPSAAWEQWLAETGELPPDFAALTPCAQLPPLLERTHDGRVEPLVLPDQWVARRRELLAELEHWFLGTSPPPPDNLEATLLDERELAGCTVRQVELRFGPGQAARLWAEIQLPPGDRPCPVFMTQQTHAGWARIALRRGYLTCRYAGADPIDGREDWTDTFVAAYPEYDFSRLMRRGWAASRCLDYLAGEPRADVGRAAIAGHSRNGKTSLMAAARDERFKVVISSSSGAGGSLPTRYLSEQNHGEGIEHITRVFPDWFHPRWRFFVGREHLLPFDLHTLLALAAPRACLLSLALNDGVEHTWALEAAYRAVQPVWRLYGAEERLRILRRPGDHGTDATTIERYLDWCDHHLRGVRHSFPERLLWPFDWDLWRARAQVTPNLAALRDGHPDDVLALADGRRATTPELLAERRREVAERVAEMLGPPPPEGPAEPIAYGEPKADVQVLLRRSPVPSGLVREGLVAGEYLPVDIWRPAAAEGPLPAILWLPPFGTARGYIPAYHRGSPPHQTFARAGYAVIGHDPLGTGGRVEQIEDWTRRHPTWSLLGQLLRDARAALTAALTSPWVDPARVWVVGFSLGALAALHLAPFEPRLAGLAVSCPPPPFRTDTDVALTGGIARWSKRVPWLPRLGFFEGHEAKIPYDLPDLLAAMAPRPTLVVTPTLDREAPLARQLRAVEAARPAFALLGAAQALQQQTPETYHQFDQTQQELVLDWLDRQTVGPDTASPRRQDETES